MGILRVKSQRTDDVSDNLSNRITTCESGTNLIIYLNNTRIGNLKTVRCGLEDIVGMA